MELTPEERERIYLEERARIEARRQIESKRVTPGKIIGWAALGLVGLLVLLFVIGVLVDAGKTPEENAHDELEACLYIWQRKLSDKGYSYEDGKIGAALQCSAEIEKWRKLKK